MSLSDLDWVCEIEKAVHGEGCWTRASFAYELNDTSSAYWVLSQKVDGARRGLGYIGMNYIFEEGHITNLSVSPQHQGQGYGEFLLLYSIRQAQNSYINKLTLEVRSGNSVALNLYKKYAFIQVGLRPKYYKNNGEDALILWTPSILEPEYIELVSRNEEQLLKRFSV